MDHVKSQSRENKPSIEEKWSGSGDILGKSNLAYSSKNDLLHARRRSMLQVKDFQKRVFCKVSFLKIKLEPLFIKLY